MWLRWNIEISEVYYYIDEGDDDMNILLFRVVQVFYVCVCMQSSFSWLNIIFYNCNV